MMRSRKEAIRRQQEYVQKIIDDRRSGRQVAEQPDLLSRMLEQTDPETDRKMPDDMIAANLITFFAAGHDSTSSLLTTAMFYISQYPEVEERLVAEIKEVLPGEDDVPTYQDLKKLKYMTQVLKETPAAAPPSPWVSQKGSQGWQARKLQSQGWNPSPYQSGCASHEPRCLGSQRNQV